MVGWSFLNLLDAELFWLSYLFGVLVAALIVSKVFTIVCIRCPSILFMQQPLVEWIWIVSIFYALNLVTDQLLTESLGISYKLFFLASLCFLSIRLGARFKNMYVQNVRTRI
jgi:hypothetical protein